MSNQNKIILGLIILIILFFSFSDGGKKQKFITIGTGGVTGVYYPTGGAISRIVNKESVSNLKAYVESTGGSVYNINAVLSGDLDFGIAQSDRQYEAYNGLAEWADSGAQKDLRSVFSIHSEAITLVASQSSRVFSPQNLKGKRVNIGNVGSGTAQNARTVLGIFNITETDFNAEEIKASESPRLIQDGRIDAFFYTVGHPNGNIKEATAGRVPVRIVDIQGAGVDNLIKENLFYSKAVIPVSLYPSVVNSTDINTFGVKATLVSSSKVRDDVVYTLVKGVFENLEEFKKFHPAFANLTPEQMLEGLSAPLHKGAEKYYREAGLIDLVDDRLLSK